MDRIEQHDTYLPATDDEIIEFSDCLDDVADRFSLDDGHHESLTLSREITLDDGGLRSVRFVLDTTGIYVYEIELSETVPAEPEWGLEELAIEYLSENMSEESFDDLMEEVKDEVDSHGCGFVSYLQRTKKLDIRRGPESVEAGVAFDINVLDSNYEEIMTLIGAAPEVNLISKSILEGDPDDETIEWLTYREEAVTSVTRADLILFADSMKGCGFMDADVEPYLGCTSKLTVPKFFTIGNRARSED